MVNSLGEISVCNMSKCYKIHFFHPVVVYFIETSYNKEWKFNLHLHLKMEIDTTATTSRTRSMDIRRMQAKPIC